MASHDSDVTIAVEARVAMRMVRGRKREGERRKDE